MGKVNFMYFAENFILTYVTQKLLKFVLILIKHQTTLVSPIISLKVKIEFWILRLAFNLCMAAYLYGDLAIYVTAVAKSGKPPKNDVGI